MSPAGLRRTTSALPRSGRRRSRADTVSAGRAVGAGILDLSRRRERQHERPNNDQSSNNGLHSDLHRKVSGKHGDSAEKWAALRRCAYTGLTRAIVCATLARSRDREHARARLTGAFALSEPQLAYGNCGNRFARFTQASELRSNGPIDGRAGEPFGQGRAEGGAAAPGSADDVDSRHLPNFQAMGSVDRLHPGIKAT